MPTGINDFYDPVQRDFAERKPTDFPRQALVPRRQVDPFIRSINQLKTAGLLDNRFADTAIVNQLRRSSFIRTGTVSRGSAFEPGDAGVGEDDLRAFRSLSRHTVLRDDQTSRFIPREHSEPSGFLKLLETLAAFNFAVAGAANSLVNLAKGREEENNPFVEFWRGVTLKDKETFSDVFENLGWQGEDGFAYWSRATAGFVADVLLDPINFFTFGVGGAAAKAGSKALRRKAVTFANGTRNAPARELGRIGKQISERAIAGVKRGDAELPLIVSNLSKRRARDLAKRVISTREMEAIRTGTLKDITEDLTFKSLTAPEARALEDSITSDVFAMFESFAKHRNPDELRRIARSTRAAEDPSGAFLKLIGADPEVGTIMMTDLLKLDNKSFTINNMIDYLTGNGAGIKKLLDPGGIKFGIPFTRIETSIIESAFFDNLKFNIDQAIGKWLGNSAKFLVSKDRPEFIRKSAEAVGLVAKAAKDSVSGGIENVQRLFGLTKSRNPYVGSLIAQRQAHNESLAKIDTAITQDYLSVKRGGKTKPLSLDEKSVLRAALAREEDAALEWVQSGRKFFDEKNVKGEIQRLVDSGDDAGAKALRESYGNELGYKEKHLESTIRKDNRLSGHSQGEVDQLVDLARNLDGLFREVYDNAAAEGLEFAFLGHYLPTQYNLSPRFNLNKGKLRRRLSDDDPFVRVRRERRSVATTPVVDGGLGLTEIDNLFGLVFNRIHSAHKAQVDRHFLGQLVDNYGVHPRQIQKVLDAEFGPNGTVAAEIIASMNSRSGFDIDLWTQEVALAAVPKLQELQDLVQTGRLPEAVEWLKNNETIINAVLVSGKESLVVALEKTLNETRGILTDYLAAAGTDYLKVVESARDVIGREVDDVIASIRQFTGNAADADVQLTAALSDALEFRVRKLLDFQEEVTGATFASGAAADWVTASKQTGQDAGRFFLMDETLRTASKKVNKETRNAIEGRFGNQLDEWAENLVDVVIGGRRADGISVRLEGFDDQLAVLMSRSLTVEAIEQSVDHSGILVASELAEAKLVRGIQEIGALRGKANAAARKAKINEVWETVGTNPGVLSRRAIAQYRAGRNLPELPRDFSFEAKQEILARIKRAMESGKKRGLQFFEDSPYLPKNIKSGNSVSQRAQDNVKKRIEEVSKGDPGLKQQLTRMIFTPNAFRSGSIWQPLEGMMGLARTGYDNMVNQVLDEMKGIARKSIPTDVLKRSIDQKLKFNWLVKDPGYSRLASENKLVLQMTNRFQSAMRNAVAGTGDAADEAAQAVTTFAEAITESLRRRGFVGDTVDMTKAHEALQDAVGVFTDDIAKVMKDTEAGEVIGSQMNAFALAINKANQNVGEIYRDMIAARDKLIRINATAEGLAASPEQIAEAISQIEQAQSQVYELIASIEQRAEASLHILDDVGIGRELGSRLLKKHPVLGNLWFVADSLRGVQNRVPEAIRKAFTVTKLEQARAHVTTAESVIRKMGVEIEALRPAIEGIQDEVRIIDRLTEKNVEIARYVEATAGRGQFLSGDLSADIQQYLQAAVSDEFLRGGSRTQEDWLRAVERVLEKGPTNEALRGPWEAGLKDLDSETFFDEVRRTLLGDPLDAGDVAAFRASHRIPLVQPPPGQQVAIDAALAAFEDFPEFGAIRATDELISEIERRAAAKLTTAPDASTQFELFAEGAFLQPEEAVEAARALRDERVWIDAVEDVITERAQQLSSIPNPFTEQAPAYIRRFRENVQRAYEGLGQGLTLPPGGVRQALDETAQSSRSLLVKAMRDDFDPWGELIGQIEGAIPPGLDARARFWLWQMGVRTGDDITSTGLTANLHQQITESLGEYTGSDAFRTLKDQAYTDATDSGNFLVTENRKLIEDHFLARAELELFEKQIIPNLEEGVNLAIQGTPDDLALTRAMHQIKNYLDLQVLRAEHTGLTQVLAAMPSRGEVQFTKLKLELTNPEAAAAVAAKSAETRLVGAEINGGGVFPVELSTEVDQAVVVNWQNTNEQWQRVLSGPARRMLETTGLDVTKIADSDALRADLKRIGVEFDEKSQTHFYGKEGATTTDNLELNSAIGEISGYLEFQAETVHTLRHSPALESQVIVANRILGDIFPADEVAQSQLIFALTGRARLDQLSAVEAAQVVDFLGTRTAPEVRRFGGKMIEMSQRDQTIGRLAKGRIPPSVARRVDMDPKVLLAREQTDLGTPYELVSVQFPKFGDAAVSPGGVPLDEGILAERYVAELLEDNILQDTTVVGPLARAIRGSVDWVTNKFKWLQTAPFPAFHTRNAADVMVRASFAMTLSSWNMKKNWEYWKLLTARDKKKLGGVKVSLGGVDYEAEFLMSYFERYGGPVDFTEKLGFTRVDIAGVTDPRLHPGSTNFFLRNSYKVTDTINNIAGRADNVMRLNLWFDGLSQGLPPAEAMRRTQKFVFDYAHALTPFEREWMRRLFPFYTFMRFNIPLQLEILAKHPGVVSTMAKTNFLVRDDDRNEYSNLMPSFIREQWQINLGVEGGQMRVLAGRNLLATEDLAFLGDILADGDLKEGFFKELFGRLNPMFKLPVELYDGKNFYFGSDIRENQTLNRAVFDFPVVRDWLQLRKVVVNGETMWRANGFRWHILQQTHFGRLYRTLAETIGDNDAKGYQSLLPVFTGLRLQTVDLDRRFNELVKTSTFNQTQLLRAIDQGDFVQVRRIHGLTERSTDEQARVDESFNALRLLSTGRR